MNRLRRKIEAERGGVSIPLASQHVTQLTARRLGCGLRLRGASRALEQTVAFCGLCDVLPVEGVLGGIRWHGRQPEEREPARGVEERVEARDPPV